MRPPQASACGHELHEASRPRFRRRENTGEGFVVTRTSYPNATLTAPLSLPKGEALTSCKAFHSPNRATANSRTLVRQLGPSLCIAKAFMITFFLRKLVYATT